MGLLGPEVVCSPLAPQLPGQGSGGSDRLRAGKGRAAPHRSQAGRAEGARGGARGWGGGGAGARHLIKRLRVSREQRAHSAVGSCPRGGAAGQRARLVPGVGPDAVARGDEGGRGSSGSSAAASTPARSAQLPAPLPGRLPSHGGRGAAVAALPVRRAPAAARRRLQLGHPRGQCDPKNWGFREPLRLLAGHAPAAAAGGQAAVSSPTLPTPTRAPALLVPAAGPGPAPPRPGLRRPARSAPAPRAPPPHSAGAAGEAEGRPLRTAACQAGLPSVPGVYFKKKKKYFSAVLSFGHVCWELGRWHLHVCVWGRGDKWCRVAVSLRCGYRERCSRKIQAFSTLREHHVPLHTRAPRRSWKVTFHRVLLYEIL